MQRAPPTIYHRYGLALLGMVFFCALCSASRGGATPTPWVSPTFVAQVAGQGPPLFFLSGLGCSGEIWDVTVDRLKDRFECHVLSLRGMGGTPRMGSFSGDFITLAAAELIRYVRECACVRPVIIGHSLGGAIALKVAVTEPGLPKGLVIVDSLPCLSAGLGNHKKVGATAGKVLCALRWMPNFVSQGVQSYAVINMVNAWRDRWRLIRMVLRSDRIAIQQALQSLFTYDVRSVLAKIRCPTLVLIPTVGKFGPAREPDLYKKRVVRQYAPVSQARIVFFEKARHFLMYDDPDGFLAAVETFCADE